MVLVVRTAASSCAHDFRVTMDCLLVETHTIRFVRVRSSFRSFNVVSMQLFRSRNGCEMPSIIVEIGQDSQLIKNHQILVGRYNRSRQAFIL